MLVGRALPPFVGRLAARWGAKACAGSQSVRKDAE